MLGCQTDDSGLLNDLLRYVLSPSGQPKCFYGDPAYPLRIHLQAPFRNAVVTPAMQAFNFSRSAVRTISRLAFGGGGRRGGGGIVYYFIFTDFNKNLKLVQVPLGKCIFLVHYFAMPIPASMEIKLQIFSIWISQIFKTILFNISSSDYKYKSSLTQITDMTCTKDLRCAISRLTQLKCNLKCIIKFHCQLSQQSITSFSPFLQAGKCQCQGYPNKSIKDSLSAVVK